MLHSAPPAWQVGTVSDSAQLVAVTTMPEVVGTDFPFGCRYCAKSTARDTVEICEMLGGVVHADCHTELCIDPQCAYLTCTEDRCDAWAECAWCDETVCEQHRGDQLMIEDGDVYHDHCYTSL